MASPFTSESARSDVIRVGIIARYPAVRAGLRAMIGASTTAEVTGEAADLGALAEASSGLDVVVWALEDVEVIGHASALARTAGVVFLGDPPESARELLELPLPWAWLSREAEAGEILAAIQAVHAGLISVDPASIRVLAPPAVPARPQALGVIEEPLTPREREVLQLMAEGLPNKAIARRLGISEHTVKFHVASVLAKLGASSRTEAVRLGARAGLVVL